jgi:NAD(P)-dependent dehydrogenase (short-subunit alcohol dehydrogenase family)
MSGPDRVALVTGAAQGVGQAIAQRLSQEGVRRLVLVDREGGLLEEAASTLRETGCEVVPLVLDLSDVEAGGRAVAEARGRFGRLDILCNAAGVTDRGGIADTTPSIFDRVFAINTRAPFFMMQAAATAMKPDGGVIVNVCSMLAYGGPPFLLAYSASKAALVALTKGTANALKRDRIRVFGINLGWTVTPSEHRVQTQVHGLAESWAEDIGRKLPFGRLLVPSDVGDLVAFLVAEQASMMTGAIVDLDQFVAGTTDDNPGALA